MCAFCDKSLCACFAVTQQRCILQYAGKIKLQHIAQTVPANPAKVRLGRACQAAPGWSVGVKDIV